MMNFSDPQMQINFFFADNVLYMLENTEGGNKNEQFRETGNIGYTRHRTKTNKTKNTSLYTNKHK
jgi:hypothetical protein